MLGDLYRGRLSMVETSFGFDFSVTVHNSHNSPGGGSTEDRRVMNRNRKVKTNVLFDCHLYTTDAAEE